MAISTNCPNSQGLISNEDPATKSCQTELHGIESFERHFRKCQKLDFIGSTNVQASADPCRYNGDAILERKLDGVGRPLLALRTTSVFEIRSHCQCSFPVVEVIRQYAYMCHPLRVEDVPGGYCRIMHRVSCVKMTLGLDLFSHTCKLLRRGHRHK
jgi:hypothetical protein